MSDTRSKLLALLRSQPAEGFLSGQQAAEALGVSRAAVCKKADQAPKLLVSCAAAWSAICA